MTGLIGDITCTFLKGVLPGVKVRVHTWTLPGVNGYGAQILGLGDSEFQVVAVRYGSASLLVDWQAALEALQGTVVTIRDDTGRYHPNCLIERVSHPQRSAAWPYGMRAQLTIQGKVCG